jgi:hypothetical protein
VNFVRVFASIGNYWATFRNFQIVPSLPTQHERKGTVTAISRGRAVKYCQSAQSSRPNIRSSISFCVKPFGVFRAAATLSQSQFDCSTRICSDLILLLLSMCTVIIV